MLRDRTPEERLKAIQSIYDRCCKATKSAELKAEAAFKKFYGITKGKRTAWIEEGYSDGTVRWDEAWLKAWGADREWVNSWVEAWIAAKFALDEWCRAASEEGRAREAADSSRLLTVPWPIFAAEEARNHHAEDPIWISAQGAKRRADSEWDEEYDRVCEADIGYNYYLQHGVSPSEIDMRRN